MISAYAGLKAVQALVPILGNTTAEGTGVVVDRQGFQSALMIAEVGISGDTLSGSIYWTIAFQECDDTTPGNFTNIAAGDLDGGVNDHVINAAAEDPTTIVRGYKGSKRYLRILLTQTGTHTNGTPISGVIVLKNPIYVPITPVTELGG
jgi:hypothetical protein